MIIYVSLIIHIMIIAYVVLCQYTAQVNKLTSTQTQIPYDYYTFPFCRPSAGVHHYGENLGEFLTGDRIENSPYDIGMKEDKACKVLCSKTLNE